jgi:hypothetical protein
MLPPSSLLRFLATWVLSLAASQVWSQPSQRVLLKKGDVEVELSVPGDSENYRGTRFDHSGMFQAIRFKDHQLCQRWHSGKPNPDANDDVTGPCEEFGNSAPLGYQPNQPGTTFLKIGVGILKQPVGDTRYQFSTPYEFVERGKWQVTKADTSITFTQEQFDGTLSRQFGYRYQKRIQVSDQGFLIDHSLTNLGTSKLSTDHYNHNFFLVDSDPVGKNYELELAFPIEAINRNESFAAVTNLDGKTLRFSELIGPNRSFFAELIGHRQSVADHHFVLKHKPTGVAIDCNGDRSLKKFNFWGRENTICPEPYVQIELNPEQKLEWRLEYRFSQAN